MAKEYEEYLERCHAVGGRIPLRFEEFVSWAEAWDREYSALWKMPGGPAWQTLAPPEALARGWRAEPVAAVEPPIAPTFTRFLEFRLVGPPPFAGGTEARAEG